MRLVRPIHFAFTTCFVIGLSAVPVRADASPKFAANASASGDGKGAANQSNDGGKEQGDASKGSNDKKEKSSGEKMQARFPQPSKVGHLIGLPVLDGSDSTIGYVQQIVRTTDGKIKLIVLYRKWFGWARDGGPLAWGRRPVAVPIEVVAILALQINALEMERSDFDKAPTWSAEQTNAISSDETIQIALGRR